MKRQDIVVGEFYAEHYANDWEKYANKVKVVEAPVSIKSRSYPYSTRTLVMVEDHRGGRRPVPTRQIRELWSTFEPRKLEREAVIRANRNAALEAKNRRAREVRDLVPLLEDAGLPPEVESIYGEDKAVFLADHGLLLILQESSIGYRYEVVAPLARGLVNYIDNASRIEVPFQTLLDLAYQVCELQDREG